MKRLRILLVLIGVMLTGLVVGQKAKNLNIKTESEKTSGGSKLLQPSFLLNGSKQIGLRYVLNPIGWGAEFDLSYVLTNKIILEIGGGYHDEEFNSSEVTRVPVHFGAKYNLLNQNKIFLLYGGLAFNSYFQSYSGIDTDKKLPSTLLGPSLFGEAMISVLSKLSVVIRSEAVFIVNERVGTGNDEKAFTLRNISFGIRKTL